MRIKKQGNAHDIAITRLEYTRARKLLLNNNNNNSIKSAKNACWRELLKDIDNDPWGKPYQMIISKLKRKGRNPLTYLKKSIVDNIVTSLFPSSDEISTSNNVLRETAEDINIITHDELRLAMSKMCSRKTALMDSAM